MGSCGRILVVFLSFTLFGTGAEEWFDPLLGVNLFKFQESVLSVTSAVPLKIGEELLTVSGQKIHTHKTGTGTGTGTRNRRF